MSGSRLGAILVAAGSGTRMHADTPKQFGELGGRVLVTYALQTLVESSEVGPVVVVVPEGWEERTRSLCTEAGIDPADVRAVAGGATRQESVLCGLQELSECSHVLVHDAARPFVTQSHIESVVQVAREHEAATLAVPVTDTLMRGRADVSSAGSAPAHDAAHESVDRRGIWAVQTPQVFERALLVEAHERAQQNGVDAATDDGSLVLALGRAVELVEGSWWNVKITTPEDLQRAEWILLSAGIAAASEGNDLER